jgi:ribosomal protein L29
MKIKDLRKLSEKDFDAKLIELKHELIKLHTQVATGTQLKNPKHINLIKRTIAQIKTIRQEGKSKA